MKTLRELETELLLIQEENPQDSDIYYRLHSFCFMYLQYTHKIEDRRLASDVAWDFAYDLYIKIAFKDFRVKYLFAYTSRVIIRYIIARRNLISEIIYTNGNPKLEEAIIRMSHSETQSYDLNSQVACKCYLEDLKKTVRLILLKKCRYRKDSSKYMNLEVSLILSILKGSNVYYKLDLIDVEYLKVLKNCVQSELRKEILSVTSTGSSIMDEYKVLNIDNMNSLG